MAVKRTLAPYLVSQDTVARRYWGSVAALVPLVSVLFFTDGVMILHFLLLSLVSALAFEFLSTKILSQKEHITNGETIFLAVLFSLLLPRGCPPEMIFLGSFLSVFVSKNLLGGTGSFPFHPVFLARAFLQQSFPAIFNHKPLFLDSSMPAWTLAAIAVAAPVLFFKKNSRREAPLIYILLCTFFSFLIAPPEEPILFSSAILFAAFFFFNESTGMPLTQKGSRIFMLGAALLSVFLNANGFSINMAGYAILLMNLLTPWLDAGLKPASYPRFHNLKATYEINHQALSRRLTGTP